MRALTVWWEGAVVGSLTADRHGAMRFAYDGGWVADRSAAPLSVSRDLAHAGLDENALARCAVRTADRARRLALTV